MIFNKERLEIIRFALQFLLSEKELEEKLHSLGEEPSYRVSQKWNSIYEEDPSNQPLPAKNCPSSSEIKDLLRDVSLNL